MPEISPSAKDVLTKALANKATSLRSNLGSKTLMVSMDMMGGLQLVDALRRRRLLSELDVVVLREVGDSRHRRGGWRVAVVHLGRAGRLPRVEDGVGRLGPAHVNVALRSVQGGLHEQAGGLGPVEGRQGGCHGRRHDVAPAQSAPQIHMDILRTVV